MKVRARLGWHPVVLLAACAVAAPASRSGHPLDRQDSHAIDTVLMREVTRVLAHDSLAGRAAGTPEADAAARYIAEQCRVLQLQTVSARYLHPVPLADAVLDPDRTLLTLRAGNVTRTFSAPDGFLPTGATATTLAGFRGQAVFVGSRRDIAQLEAIDLSGKVAVTGESVLTPLQSRTLRRRGATGIVSLAPAPEARRYVERLRGRSPLHLTEPIRSSFFPGLPTVVGWSDVSDALASMAQNTARQSLPVALGVSIDVSVAFRPDTSARHHNVLCRLSGSHDAARDTAIILTAHYDHLGIGEPDQTGDSIFNGFSDNAAGVAMLLAIARAMQERPAAPRHSVLFAFFTAEERGLLGSDYFVHRPPWRLDRILGVVNLDAGAPAAPPWSWRLAGGDSSALGDLARDVAASRGWSATTSAASANSDYFPFWREGIPAIFIVPGPGPFEGLSTDSSDALRTRWDRYHRADDEWTSEFPFEGLARYGEFAYRVVDALDRVGLRRLPR